MPVVAAKSSPAPPAPAVPPPPVHMPNPGESFYTGQWPSTTWTTTCVHRDPVELPDCLQDQSRAIESQMAAANDSVDSWTSALGSANFPSSTDIWNVLNKAPQKWALHRCTTKAHKSFELICMSCGRRCIAELGHAYSTHGYSLEELIIMYDKKFRCFMNLPMKQYPSSRPWVPGEPVPWTSFCSVETKFPGTVLR